MLGQVEERDKLVLGRDVLSMLLNWSLYETKF